MALRSSTPIPRGLARLGLLIVLFWGLAAARAFVVPLALAALLAFTLAPVVRLARRIRLPEWAAIALSALVLVIPFVAVGYLLARQVQGMIQDFPHITNSIRQFLIHLDGTAFARKLGLSDYLNPDAITRRLSQIAGEALQIALAGLAALLDAGSSLALVLFFAILMLASRLHLWRATLNLLEPSWGPNGEKLLLAMVGLVERFLIARLLIVFIITGADSVILTAFGVPYSLLLGSFLGVMTLVPAIGFIIAVIPALVVSLSAGHSAISTVLMGLSLLGMSAVEGNVLTPALVGGRLNINALSTFVGIFAGAQLWGPWGMFLSIPALGALRIVLASIPSMQRWGELLAQREEPVKLGVPPPRGLRRRSKPAVKSKPAVSGGESRSG